MKSSGLQRRLSVLVLAAGVFTTGLNVSLLSPLVTLIGQEFDVSDAAVGQLAALHAIVAGVVALLVAPWIDRYPRRLVLSVESALLCVATAVSALAPSFGWLLAGRLLAGLGGAIIAAMCYAAAGDLFSDPRQRNRVLGIIAASFSLSTVAGLPLITQLADIAGWRWGMAALLVPAVVVVSGAWLLPSNPDQPVAYTPALGYRQVISNSQVNWLLAAMIVMCMALAGWVIYFGAYTKTVFSLNANALSTLFILFGIADIIGCSVAPALLRLGSARAVYVSATLVMSASLIVAGFIDGAWWLLIPVAMLVGLSSSILYLTVSVMLLDSMPSARGAVMALQTGGFEFGWALGAALTGATLSLTGSYTSVYPLLGVVLAGSLVFLRRSSEHPSASADATTESVMYQESL